MITSILLTVFRTTIAYILLLVLVRIMGRKIISQMTFFNFIVAITLGSVTASLSLGSKFSPINAATVLITFTALVFITGYIHIKSFKMRKLLNSEPIALIKNGEIVFQNMKKIRLGIDDLTSLLRKKNIFNMADVEFAIMENDGKMSVLKKSQKQPLTPKDIHLATSYTGLSRDVIMDGEIMHENLRNSSLDEDGLVGILANKGIKDVKEVFYAGLDNTGNLYVSMKNKREKEKEGEYGID